MRFAVPLTAPNGGWRASMDDVRAMVQHVHKELKVQFPADDYFMNLLGVGKLAGKVPKAWSHNSIVHAKGKSQGSMPAVAEGSSTCGGCILDLLST